MNTIDTIEEIDAALARLDTEIVNARVAFNTGKIPTTDALKARTSALSRERAKLEAKRARLVATGG